MGLRDGLTRDDFSAPYPPASGLEREQAEGRESEICQIFNEVVWFSHRIRTKSVEDTMARSRTLAAPSVLVLSLLLSCDGSDPTVPGTVDPPDSQHLLGDQIGPVPGPISDAAPEPGPASEGPEPTLSAAEEPTSDPEESSPSGSFPETSSPSSVGEGLVGTDLLWRNSVNGKNAIWEMDGVSRVASRKLPRVKKQDWTIVGIGDFTGDSKPDIVWRNTANGKNAVWEMDNGARISNRKLPRVEDLSWEIVGVGEMTGDGRTDLVWRNNITALLTIWEMNGLSHGATHLVNLQRLDLTWGVEGVGDLTGDGWNDIIWRSATTGRNEVWEMDGVTYAGIHELESEPDLNWDMVGLGEMTGDGKTDVVWRNSETGKNVLWEMDGLIRVGMHGLGLVRDTEWNIVGLADLVWAAKVEGVELAPKDIALIVGSEKEFLATPFDEEGNVLSGREVRWESSRPSVATVTNEGVVTAVSEGEATISATIEGETATAKVTSYASTEVWLSDYPRIANRIYWETPGKRTYYYDFSPEDKQELDTYFLGAVNGGVFLPDPAENLYADYLLDDDWPRTLLSPTAAKSLYLANIGHSLAMERSGSLGWSLHEYDDLALSALLRPYDQGFYLEEGFRGTSLTGYFLHPIFPQGVLPAPPSVTYSFLTDHDLVRGDRLSTIARVIDWGRAELYHDFGQTAKTHEEHWQYRGAAPVSRILSGTIRLTDPTQTVQSYTPGCGGTTLFLNYLLRAVNIPVLNKPAAGHWGPHFLSEAMVIPHGDHIYTAWMRTWTEGDPIPSEEILISEAQWEEWFGESVPFEDQKKNLSRRMAALVQEYLPDLLLRKRCEDIESGANHQDSEVYNSFLKEYYSVEELEALILWERLDTKIADLGGCALIPPSWR
jgi:hypothetical protein